MNKRFPFLASFLLAALLVFADWRTEVKGFFGPVPDFEGAARYLQGIFPSAAAADQPQLSFLLGFLYRKLNDKENELYWVRRHFESHGGQPFRFGFFSDVFNIEITDFFMNWSARYPLVHGLALTPAVFPWPERPAQLTLALQSSLAVNYRLARRDEVLAEGLLKKGENLLPIDAIPLDRSAAIDDLVLEVWSPAITVKKALQVEVVVITPEGAEVEDGQVRIKGKSVRSEDVVQMEMSKFRYFDRKFFVRHFCLHGAAAAAIWTGNQAVLARRLSDGSLSSGSEPFYRSARNFCNFLSLGFAAKAAVGLIQSFKTRTEKKELIVKSQAAVEYNRFLAEAVRQAEKSVMIRVALTVGEAK